MNLIPLLFTFVCGLLVANAQIQETFSVFSNASDIYPLPSNLDCANALASTIQCESTILYTLTSSSVLLPNLTASDLASLCTPTCYTSLASAITTVDLACPGWPYILGDTNYIASFPLRWLQYNFNLSCVMSGSLYCLNIAQNATGSPDGSILDLPQSQLCADCTLQPLNVQMTSPFGWDANFVANWTAIQSECGVTFNSTIPSSLVLDSASQNATSYNTTAKPTLVPASSSNCVFGSYQIQIGDTCQSITAARSLSYDQFISINGLDMNCTALPAPGQQICLSGACGLYTVQDNDTCVQIYQAHSITWTQLLAWNPQLDGYCSNIDTQVGKGICISPPGGGYTPTTTVSYITGTPTALATPTAAIAPGSDRALCGLWYQALANDTCPQILQHFQITNDTFYELNPSLNQDCSNLLAGFDYCVAVFGNTTDTTTSSLPTSTFASLIDLFSGSDFPQGTGFAQVTGNGSASPVTGPPTIPTPPPQVTETPNIAPGTIGNDTCLQYYTVQAGDTCFAIEAVFNIQDDQFHSWNPEVDAACGNIQIGLAYCVYGPITFTTPVVIVPTTTTSTSTTTTTSQSGAPTNVASGTITTGCTQYYTIVSGDFCGKIDDQFGITFDQLLQWNPEIDTNCDNIQLGLAYCVAGPSSTTTTTTTPATSPTASGTITTGCTQYYTVVSGDSCPGIESTFGITFAQFQQWNPEVDNNCDNIFVGLQYCVSGPAATTTTSPAPSPTASGSLTTAQGCQAYYTTVSGDFCAKIESQFSITSTQFLTWNPEINSGCTNLQLGLQYCVSGP